MGILKKIMNKVDKSRDHQFKDCQPVIGGESSKSHHVTCFRREILWVLTVSVFY